EIERMVINGNGNVGIDLPPGPGGLDSAVDQVQIGGGMIPPPGYPLPIPGLTIYGGNRFEGMPKPGGGSFPIDWRGIYFNHYEDHVTGITSRFSPISSCGIAFADANGGLMQLTCWPPDALHPLTDSLGSMVLSLTGNTGLEVWSDERKTGGSQYHHLFNVWRPGYGGADSLRNVNGLFLHFTPVLIDTNADATNFTSLAHVFPRLGDGKTWMLAVNGPALFKEAYVSTDWPDFVFQPSYKLPTLESVEKYIDENHHLPDVPSASKIAETGVPLGQTEALLLKKIEELTRYAIEQNKKIEQLDANVQKLENEKGH
ncbi:MAG TPA: hypothetical protein VFX22_05495, partial [Candidatus Kapabacteria bacterium]|nr:hypothetical protein [Candidatus Kapabacteria bacterium]